MSFDEQPDGDPHGECAAEISELTQSREWWKRRWAESQTRITAVEDALRLLMRAYVNTLEGGRDRILSLGGTCDDVPTMEAGDPALRHARAVLDSQSAKNCDGAK